MKQLGIILDSLLPSQVNFYAQAGALDAIEKGILKDVTIFYVDKTAMVMNQARLSVCHVSHLKCFQGDVMATSLVTSIKLQNTPVQGQKWFYIYYPEWLMGNPFPSGQIYKAYRHPDFNYVARSKLYSNLLQNNFNTAPDAIMEDFDLEKIYGK